ncbi:hypothetical protein ACTHGU_15520 [Chitinophagaceae bacterium MMS25-I14]
MFSSFRKEKVTVGSITIPDFGWPKEKEDSSVIQWVNPERDTAVSVNFIELTPNIPTIKNITALRDFYRKIVNESGGGIIEIEILQVGGILVIKSIIKLPQKPSGMTYIASLTMPFRDCSFVLKVQCAEVGITGIRDAVIVDRSIAEGTLDMTGNGIAGWFEDPYDKACTEGFLMNKSEQEIYDKEFPDHPLTRARKIIRQIESSFKLKPEIKKLTPFTK